MAKAVRDIDRGWKRIKQDMKELGRSSVKVGIRAGEGVDSAATKVAGVRRKYRAGQRRRPTRSAFKIVDYAVLNEFGTEHIPARPFMRHTADTQEGRLREYARRMVGPLIDGRKSVDEVLNSIGLWYQAATRRTVRNSSEWAEPNAPATIAMKGSSKPLVDHGMLISAIDYEVIKR